MLKKRAVKYYKNGYNCSQCILKACADEYNVKIPKECIMMCNGINNGLGVGSVCSVLLACIMFLSIKEPENIQHKRMLMVDEFAKINGSMNCCKIKKNDCTLIIENACDILEKIID